MLMLNYYIHFSWRGYFRKKATNSYEISSTYCPTWPNANECRGGIVVLAGFLLAAHLNV